MTIETKYNVYDEIWFLANNKSCKSKIRGIKIEVSSNEIEITETVTYLCNEEADARVHIKVEQSNAFPTKEALLQSL